MLIPVEICSFAGVYSDLQYFIRLKEVILFPRMLVTELSLVEYTVVINVMTLFPCRDAYDRLPQDGPHWFIGFIYLFNFYFSFN